MIPGAIETKLMIIVFMAIVNILLLKRNKRQPATQLVQSFSPSTQQDYNINSNKPSSKPQTQKTQENYTQKLVNSDKQTQMKNYLSIKNNGQQLKFNQLDKYFVHQKGKENRIKEIEVQKEEKNSEGARNQYQNYGDNAKYNAENQAIFRVQNQKQYCDNNQKFANYNQPLYNPQYINRPYNSQSFSNQPNTVFNPSIFQNNNANNPSIFQNPYFNPIGNPNPVENNINSSRSIFKITGPKNTPLFAEDNLDKNMEIQKSNQQYEQHHNNRCYQTLKKPKHGYKQNLFFSEGQFQKVHLRTQRSQQNSSQGQQADNQTIQYKNKCKNCIHCKQVKKQKSLSKPKLTMPAKQSFKRCLQELICQTLEQMVTEKQITKKSHFKKKKNSL